MPENLVTKDQIIDLIKSEKMKPSDLFSVDQILAEPVVKGYADDRVKERIGSEWQHRKKAEEDLEKLKKDFEPEKKKLEDEIKKLKLEAAKTQTGSLLEKEREKRSLDDRQIKFIQKRLERFNPVEVEKIEKEFSDYLDKEIDEFKTLAEVYDYKIETDTNDKDKKIITGPEDKREKVTDNKYLDPAQNPMIKTD